MHEKERITIQTNNQYLGTRGRATHKDGTVPENTLEANQGVRQRTMLAGDRCIPGLQSLMQHFHVGLHL